MEKSNKTKDNGQLTQVELRRYARQIDQPEVGLEGQEAFKRSTVAVIGLCGVGVATSRNLLSTGIGKVIMIDDALVYEDSLPSMSYLGVSDVGKHRCIAMREKLIELHGAYIAQSIGIYSTLPKPSNVAKLFSGCDMIIDTCRGYESTFSALDYADQKNIRVICSFTVAWKAYFGIYGDDNQKGFRDTLAHFYEKNKFCGCKKFCFGFTTATIGNIAAGYVARYLIDLMEYKSMITEYDLMKGEFKYILATASKVSNQTYPVG